MTKVNQVGKVATRVYSEDGWTIVQYHRTKVVQFNQRWIKLNSDSWRTSTTKMRINQASNQFNLNISVWQTEYKWSVCLPSGKHVDFEDNMIIDRETGDLKAEGDVYTLARESVMEYIGDINPVYGGLFVDTSNWSKGFAGVTRITDLDSGAGFDGAVLIEQGTLTIPRPESIREAIKSTGGLPITTAAKRIAAIVDSVVWYQGFDVERQITIQTESDGSMSYDGWRADIKLPDGESLLDWMRVNRGWIET